MRWQLWGAMESVQCLGGETVSGREPRVGRCPNAGRGQEEWVHCVLGRGVVGRTSGVGGQQESRDDPRTTDKVRAGEKESEPGCGRRVGRWRPEVSHGAAGMKQAHADLCRHAHVEMRLQTLFADTTRRWQSMAVYASLCQPMPAYVIQARACASLCHRGAPCAE